MIDLRVTPLIVTLGAGSLLAGCSQLEVSREGFDKAFVDPTLAGERGALDPGPVHDPPIRALDPEPEPEPAEELAEPFFPPPSSIGDDSLYEVDVRNMPIAEAVHLIASMAGVNVYLDAGLGFRVDANFPSITLDQALAVLLERNGLILIEDPPGIYWVSANDGSQIETQVFQLESVSAADVTGNLEALVGESTQIITDLNRNFIVVRGARFDLDLIDTYLAAADVLKEQVLIEVEILEIILSDEFELGIQQALAEDDLFGEFSGSIDLDLSTASTDFTATITNGDSITGVINALQTFGSVNVVSSPRVLAVTNTEAKVEVITEVPYIDTSTAVSGDPGQVGVSSQQQVEFKESGVKLTVTPVIQEGGVISLNVNQEFSEVIDFFLGIPVLDTRKVVTQFLVEGSQTAMIGGLIQDRAAETDRGVPILMDVPVLGRLFRSDEDLTERRELIVLLTPRLVDPAEASILAAEYHDAYSERVRASGLADSDDEPED